MSENCKHCGGLKMEPNVPYGYAGKVCHCCWKWPHYVTHPMFLPQQSATSACEPVVTIISVQADLPDPTKYTREELERMLTSVWATSRFDENDDVRAGEAVNALIKAGALQVKQTEIHGEPDLQGKI